LTVDVGTLDPLPIFRYRLELVFSEPLAVPAAQRAILWRGAFGTTFRSLVCHDVRLDCVSCPLRAACHFPRTFGPAIPAYRPDVARLRDPPRPFVFADPLPDAPSLPAREKLSLGLVLVGSAAVELPYFVVALRKLGEDGLGKRRTRFRVEAVRALDAAGLARATVYERGSDLVRPERHAMRARDLMRPGDREARRVRIRYLSPTDVRSEATAMAGPSPAPPFGALIRRARDRASALATFFGDGALAYDARAVGLSADRALLVAAEIDRASVSRRSTRTGERHELGGVVGSAIYEGDGVSAAMPWLRLAELIGVGKHATFGHGRIEVDALL
jgi:hypothetical protein